MRDEAEALGREALTRIASGQVVGLGTGRAASAFIRALGEAVRTGLAVQGVPTSETSAALARSLGIPLVEEPDAIDVAVDGIDEVDDRLDLIKGYGGALVREKVVASAARVFIALADHDDLVPVLGTRGRLPIEVVPFAVPFCRRRLAAMDLRADVRVGPDGQPFVTDNGNRILDAAVRAIREPAALDAALRAIPGVVGTGLFVGMADIVMNIDAASDRVRVRTRTRERPRRAG
jgi:ribose 5-phosphate isomerase A